ncbi:2-amino-4-hydroxy-6-hydroxymethyldihydropteridine diphosphokinase [Siccirubricoccus sp. KC 17139]|uniref:2-amino-4-hydroxy-6-hydroxymethyldihydropteridine pyrophosphokinase n=1 Tax=Siccirubricoccus soli TaxID=2899147 RepID=A0ABT1DAF5_9PROT|nr:2-amino-4-hydroxy-6-hydroxymethyldihydropteridine diphosphokinase [Siccirubricoccus soli]MCP2685048.1 2-amino-4-hydroxy-6-hydroxymethyldihydropteridine diphosphokinase [Siccirubricoccus soli]
MVLIALGANLPGSCNESPLATCRAAAVALDRLPGLRLLALSRWYRTLPVDSPPGAPPFINGVARLEGEVPDPAALLAALHGIEAAAGRERPFPNAPRRLDLDLIAIGDLVRPGPAPILPHPRAHLRRFVLDPLADVAPGWVHPGLGLGLDALRAALAAEPAPEPVAE